MKRLLFIFALIGLGLVWMVERRETTDLHEKIEAERREKSRLQARPRERALAPPARREIETRAALPQAEPTPAVVANPTEATTLTLGEWRPPSALRNRGQATPAAAVETALWAATGGDVASLEALLQIDESVRAKAEAILARLPKSAPSPYANPEKLIAAFATKSVPLGEAQLVWQHQQGPDDAVACVFVKNSETGSDSMPPSLTPDGLEKNPPMAAPSSKTKAAYFSLHRTDEDGWRFVVPASLVERIARELAPTPRP